MYCPICDQKPMNCDCTAEERRMYSENEDLEIEVERLRSERRWILVSDRLPEPPASGWEDGVRVLAWSKHNGIDTAWFYRDSQYGDRWSWDSTTKPTHWMPLPAEPPEVR